MSAKIVQMPQTDYEEQVSGRLTEASEEARDAVVRAAAAVSRLWATEPGISQGDLMDLLSATVETEWRIRYVIEALDRAEGDDR